MNDSEDFARALKLDRWVVVRTSTRTEPWAFGTAFFHDGYPKRHDANFVEVERPLLGTRVESVVAGADRALRPLGHRKIKVRDDSDGARIAMGLAEVGYTGEHLVVMVHRREPDRIAAASVEELEFDAIREHLAEVCRREPWGTDPETVELLTDFRRVLATGVGARFFATRVNGTLASSCELYVNGRLAQVESVDTLAEFRGRGLARACVSRAVTEAREAGADLVFIWADANDWPKELYSKLGFDPIGHLWSFQKHPA